MQVDLEHQARHGRMVHVVRAYGFQLGFVVAPRRGLPTAVGLLLPEQQLAHPRVPVVPMLSAGLVGRLDRVVVEIVEEYLSEDPKRWAKLASEVNWRRLELLLLREILLELKKLNQGNLIPSP